MPKLLNDDTMEVVKVTGCNYQFSAVRIDELGSSEYTLVAIATDISSSVEDFEPELKKCLKTVAESCKKSQRSENLMLRLLAFNQELTEIHGFKLLETITPDDYDDMIHVGGMTALCDAVHNSVISLKEYGKKLTENDYFANGIVFILTDGCDNASTSTPSMIQKEIAKIQKEECLESLNVVLIGVNINDLMVVDELDRFKSEANITQFVNIGDANSKTLASLANFISRSISSTSQALGSGQPSQSLSF